MADGLVDGPLPWTMAISNQPSAIDRFFDRNTDFDAERGGIRRLDAEAETGAVGDARRQRDPQRLVEGRMAVAAAEVARLGPRLAAAAAIRTRDTDRHVHGHDAAALRLALRQRNLGAQQTAVGF